MLRPLYHRGTEPLPILREAGWAWAGTENLDPTGIQSLVRPSRNIVAIPTELSWPTFECCDMKRNDINRLKPNDPYMGRTAPLTSKRCILCIYSTNIGTEYFKHALYSPFFSSKCRMFHNANLFGVCIIHILYTGCAKIKKNNSGAKGLIESLRARTPRAVFSCAAKVAAVQMDVFPRASAAIYAGLLSRSWR